MFQLHLPLNKKAMGLPNRISAVAVLWVWDRREVSDYERAQHAREQSDSRYNRAIAIFCFVLFW